MRIILTILVLILLAACTDKTSIPSNVLKQEKMEKVLWDMIVADRYATQFVMRDTTKKDVTQETFRLYSQVFAVHDITREEFVKSYKFYMTRPDLSKVLFDTILQRANRLKEESYKPKLANPLDTVAKPSSGDTLR
jgi:hypothetical protein